ncbi:hypothetical protein ARALYDRAFT_479617 [Arabidopsis lyrata subsp. lyrata]|uniref:Uncharacterized protein n=1 Tax=Arabidopsis lyrata subsp. lyrata TaxID=81972 RepID=D7KZY0_ARALL|nr:hypothetical protein ARALYDRAFT_479617 [Arabidopsis lyrata subsp. lyrata]
MTKLARKNNTLKASAVISNLTHSTWKKRAKKTICLRRNTQFFVTLCFFGAGGHVSISGILDFLAFGVQQPPPPPPPGDDVSTAGEGEGTE